MAKGRRYGAERLLGTCAYQSNHMISAGPEFHESDMWYGSIEPDPKQNRHMGGLSITFSGGHRPIERRHVAVAASAPVKVPDWSRFRRSEPASVIEPEVVNGEADEWVPPHVYLARGNNNKMTGATSSVFEGVGRTLKGRDMSRVRDAVWNQTGFFG